MGNMLLDVDYVRRKCEKDRRSREEEGDEGARRDGDENTHVVADGQVIREEHAVGYNDIA